MARVFIVAVENSADHLGAQLATHLTKANPDIDLLGIGGAAMSEAGLPTQMYIDGLAILGFVEGIKSYPFILARVQQVADLIIASEADAAVLIDSWGFMIRVAKRLKKLGYKGQIIKYVAPQVWAMREGRSAILARYVDHLLTIHSFDAPYFTRHNLPVHYVGNPVFDMDYRKGDGAGLRHQYIMAERPVVGVFLGSRAAEIARLKGPFADTIERVKRKIPDACFVSPVSSSVGEFVGAAAAEDARLQDVIFLPEARKFDVMAAADAALACSGTVTTQLACAGVPTAVAYKLAPMTFFAAKYLFKPDYISIVNIAAGEALMPEYIQDDATGEAMAEALSAYLSSAALRERASKALLKQTQKMRGGRGLASEKAAKAVLEILG